MEFFCAAYICTEFRGFQCGANTAVTLFTLQLPMQRKSDFTAYMPFVLQTPVVHIIKQLRP